MNNFKGAESRYKITREYCDIFIPDNSVILDLGKKSLLTRWLKSKYRVYNASWDLDRYPTRTRNYKYDYITSFQVFEHLLNPYSVLKYVKKGTGLLCSVPLRVCYAKPHWTEDEEDQHYHEFIPREFYKLLKKTGFKIIYAKKHCIIKNFGIRQLITGLFRVKRYLFVYAEKI